MDVKNLPTDNLYKFITLFCIALMLSSAYAVVSVYDSHRAQYNKVKEKEFLLLDTKKGTDKFNAQSEYISQEFLRIKSDRSFFIWFPMTAFTLSIFGGIYGFNLWRKNLQKYLDEQVKLETIILRKKAE
ncbi:hypothetical protein HHL01_05390 [Pseudoalteromonas arctica]|uniref:Uncharacterized protein n=1 Tax=Pseudoalteromonas arctica TaxID=394751 RepID=A0A7X9YF89_9GAMM|nr:hypothetical protein [Pseudoalteromonas arctica]NMF47609.1 hypothetical protein [Pseudoalteromonas arctica]